MKRLMVCLPAGVLLSLLVSLLLAGGCGPALAEAAKQECEAAMEQARTLAAALPADHLSRYFAERDLQQALVEANNGEFDECLEMAARATDEARERRHELPPGEKLKVLKPDE
jgi:hypothetical protein